jgi:hypothetical protein
MGKFKKITFRNQPMETGLAFTCRPYPVVDLRLSGKTVGFIQPPSIHRKGDRWRIYLHVASDTLRARFQNLMISGGWDSVDSAKDFIRTHNDGIQIQFNLFLLED